MKTYLLSVAIITLSCTTSDKKLEQNNINNTISKVEKLNDTLVLSNSIDRVEVLCLFFGKYRDKSFTLYLSNSNVKKVDFHNEDEVIKIKSTKIHNNLINYVNRFYIDKNEKIILNQNKRNYIKSTNYPTILVIGYKGERQIFKDKTSIGYESYDVDYSTKFIEFYNLLESLSDEW